MTGTASETVPERTVGRPRSPETERAILDAAMELLVEEGFGGMSMEAVAARAGVGKAAIYRRWSTKAEMVVESLRTRTASLIPLADTGDLRADLGVMLEGVRRAMAGEEGHVMTAFISEKVRYPELAAEYDRAFVEERRVHLIRLIQAAVDRGEMAASTDVELLAETGPAILSHRMMVRGAGLDRSLVPRIVNQLLGSQ